MRQSDAEARERPRWAEIAPAGIAVLLVAAANADKGAYTIGRWAPLAVYALVALALLLPGRRPGRAALPAVLTLWAFALWSLASVLWAEMPGAAYEGAARNILFAALFTLPVITLTQRLSARVVADGIVAILGLFVAGMVVALVVDPRPLFLAGRLEDPVGYRNGTAVLFVMAFWPLVCVAASRRGNVLLRGAALSLATFAEGIAFLTQSRGTLIGLAAGGVVAIALGPERVRRALLAIVAVAPIALFATDLLKPYDVFDVEYVTSPAAIDTAVNALLLAGGIALVAGLVIAALDRAVPESGGARRAAHGGALAVALVIAVVGMAGALVAVGNPVSYVSDKADQFTSLSGGNESGATRLGSVGGQRYDLWRVAVEEWKDHPVAGVGESGYASPYYLLRRTERNLVSAHSLPFSILAELGTVGVLLFLGFLVSAALALVRPLREASREDRRRVAALAALAAVFLGQAIVDWFWIIPGLTGLVMLSLGTAIALLHPASAGGPRRAALRWAPAAVCGVLALLAATQLVSAVKLEDARAARTQQARLDAARQAERFNPYALAPRYAQAGALEALGRRDEARRELEDALALEPTSFVTLGLLGDLEVRAGDPRAARRWYRRALALNPRDRGLRLLVRQAR